MPGVKRRSLRGPLASSATGFLSALRKHRVCGAAGDHGAVTAWIDDDGKYRATFSRWCQVLEAGTFNTKASLGAWLRHALPRMREAA